MQSAGIGEHGEPSEQPIGGKEGQDWRLEFRKERFADGQQ